MQVSYKRDMNHNYLILDPEEQIYGSEYQIRMLSMNDIRGLLKCNMKKMDGKVYFTMKLHQSSRWSGSLKRVL